MAELSNTPGATPTPAPLMLRGLRAGSALTGLSERSVWQLVNCDALPHRRVGRAVLFVVSEVQAWIDAGCPTKPNSATAFQGRTSR
jgi:predicted DNA-binding transcriptional regulator AlpA